jgi:hypothetical protein
MQQRQTALDRIADDCRMPRSSWKMIGEAEVTLTPVALQSDVGGSCLINELFKSKLPIRLGFMSEPRPAAFDR